MSRKRQYERTRLLADVALQSQGQGPARFAARVFNVSRGGCALFSERYAAPGECLTLEMTLPVAGVGIRRVALRGVVRWVKVETEGDLLGVEFISGFGDHDWLERYLESTTSPCPSRRGGGFTLTEAMIAVVIICLLVTMGTPIYSRAMEQAKVDAAAGTLKTIWSAQRIYWLENRTFGTDLADLEALDLIDKDTAESQSTPGAPFVYVMVSADEESFGVKAMRNGSGVWVGQLEIDEEGEVTGEIAGPGGVTLTPPS